MNGRELYQTIYGGGKVEQLPVAGVGPWSETLDRWHQEDLGVDEDPNEVLGLVGPDYTMGLPLELGMVPLFPVRVLAKDDDYVTLVDEYGVTKRMMRADYERSGGLMSKAGSTSSMSQWIEFPVKDMHSWKELREERFCLNIDQRLPADWEAQKEKFKRKSQTRWVVKYGFPWFGLFGPLRQLMGLVGLVFAIADNPELIHTIVGDMTDLWLAAFDYVLPEVRLDMICFFEDMCATKAPLISPPMFREFLAPGYCKVTGALRDMGVQQCFIDSDGNVIPIIPDLMACGITGVLPCEAQSGMDVARLRAEFPELALAHGIDKRAPAKGPKAIDEELEYCFTTAWTKGRYRPAPDHGLPPDISWANVQYYATRYLQWCSPPPH